MKNTFKLFKIQVLLLFCHLSIPTAFISAQQNTDDVQEGKASFYAKSFDGKMTASGEIFNNSDFTAAHKHLPFNTFVNVVNMKNKKNVIVKINDRGPFIKNRIIDLTESAARSIGGYHAGVVPVRIEVLDLFRLSPELEEIYSKESIVDCLGNVSEPTGVLLSLWSSTDLVHMLYLAGDLYLKEDVRQVYISPVKGSGVPKYHLLIGDFKTEEDARLAKSDYLEKGFRNVSLFYP